MQPTFIGIDIDRHFGGHYLHNLGKPLSQCMENIQAYIHASAERLMFVQGMASLLETPTAKKAVFNNPYSHRLTLHLSCGAVFAPEI